MPIVLASTTARIEALLHAAGFPFEPLNVVVDEAIDVEETPDGYVRRLAVAREAVAAAARPAGVVLGVASVAVIDGEVVGTPRDATEARRVLTRLSGRQHQVLTAVCLGFARDGGRTTLLRLERAFVTLAQISQPELEWYLRSGEPVGALGAYAPAGLASRFVVRVEGSPFTVLGLPVATLWQLCLEAGVLGL